MGSSSEFTAALSFVPVADWFMARNHAQRGRIESVSHDRLMLSGR
jgi:hypothetical protein